MTANSYFGLLTQASHSRTDREALARAALARGRVVNGELTKIFGTRRA
jgi:RNA-directed DNA polymerase